MSYILEALKKAQAERQLGNAPTIHAPQPVPAAQPDAASSRKPLFIGLGAGALVVALGALFMWQRGPSTPAPAPAPAAVLAGRPAATPATPGQPAAVPAPVSPGASGQGTGAASPLAAGAASNRLEVSAPPAPPPRPVHAAETPARPSSPAAGRAGTDDLAARAPARTPAAAAPPAPAAAAPRAATAQAAVPAAEDSLPYLHQLPDTIQRDIPRVTFGGYMYSANPADRLLLVDKTLRHEGEEVGPGLVLEKLMPKAAVMNFRGIRYRVAY
jgi:general secretion pathway protein B